MKFTHADFITRLTALYADNVEISRRKNADYAGPEDPFANFLLCEGLGISAETGILVRICDKIARAGRLILSATDPQVDESVADTLKDAANYLMILLMLREQRAKMKGYGRKVQASAQRKTSRKGGA